MKQADLDLIHVPESTALQTSVQIPKDQIKCNKKTAFSCKRKHSARSTIPPVIMEYKT
jgi:hypothetical protein